MRRRLEIISTDEASAEQLRRLLELRQSEDNPFTGTIVLVGFTLRGDDVPGLEGQVADLDGPIVVVSRLGGSSVERLCGQLSGYNARWIHCPQEQVPVDRVINALDPEFAWCNKGTPLDPIPPSPWADDRASEPHKIEPFQGGQALLSGYDPRSLGLPTTTNA